MSAVQLIAMASTVSFLAGWRLYFVTLVVGLGMRLGWLPMPDQLHALDVLANVWIIGISAVGAVVEFFADKIPWLDSGWDAVHTFCDPRVASIEERRNKLFRHRVETRTRSGDV